MKVIDRPTIVRPKSAAEILKMRDLCGPRLIAECYTLTCGYRLIISADRDFKECGAKLFRTCALVEGPGPGCEVECCVIDHGMLLHDLAEVSPLLQTEVTEVQVGVMVKPRQAVK